MKRQIKSLEEENVVLRQAIMEQPTINGPHLYLRRNGVMEAYLKVGELKMH